MNMFVWRRRSLRPALASVTRRRAGTGVLAHGEKSMHLAAGTGLTVVKSSMEVYIQGESSLCSRCWHRGAGRSTAPRCVSPPPCTARTCRPRTQLRGLWWSPRGRPMGSRSKHVCWAGLSPGDHHSGVSLYFISL